MWACFIMWAVWNRHRQHRPGTVLMHPATSCASPRSCCTRAPSARSSETGAPEASCSPRCQTEWTLSCTDWWIRWLLCGYQPLSAAPWWWDKGEERMEIGKMWFSGKKSREGTTRLQWFAISSSRKVPYCNSPFTLDMTFLGSLCDSANVHSLTSSKFLLWA